MPFEFLLHDWHLANEIMKVIEEHAGRHGVALIEKVVISLGVITEHNELVSKENLEENLKILSRGTVAEGAKFVIKSIKDKNKWVLEEIYAI